MAVVFALTMSAHLFLLHLGVWPIVAFLGAVAIYIAAQIIFEKSVRRIIIEVT